MKPYYQDAWATIYNVDCLEGFDIIKTGQLVITDPPYGIGLKNGDVDGHRSDRDFSIIGDDSPWIGQTVLDFCKNEMLPTITFASPWKPWKGEWRSLIAWDKGGAVGGGGDIPTCLKRSWELIQVARNKPINGPRRESVVRFPVTPMDSRYHVAAKPAGLICWLISIFAEKGDLIIDPFMGGGSTLRAAKDMGFKSIGFEICEAHCETAAKSICHGVLQING